MPAKRIGMQSGADDGVDALVCVSSEFLNLLKPLLKEEQFENGEALLQDAAACGVAMELVKFCLQLREREQNRRTFEEFCSAAAAVALGRRRPPWWLKFASSVYLCYLSIFRQPNCVHRS